MVKAGVSAGGSASRLAVPQDWPSARDRPSHGFVLGEGVEKRVLPPVMVALAAQPVVDVVFRSSGPQSPAVIALLGYLHEHGFEAAQKPIGTGIAADGREQLSFIEGTSPHPHPWSADAAWQIGAMLRRLHDTAASFVPKVAPDWRPWFARSQPGDRPVIGHGDLGPWNILARHGEPVAFIDWDYAGPVDAHWELAEVAWLNAQLHDDDVAERNGLGSPAERARQLALIVDGYGLDRAGRAGLVDRMVEFAFRSARQEAIDHGVGPATVSPTADGLPVLWAIAWRARAAAWMIDNRAVLESASTSDADVI